MRIVQRNSGTPQIGPGQTKTPFGLKPLPSDPTARRTKMSPRLGRETFRWRRRLSYWPAMTQKGGVFARSAIAEVRHNKPVARATGVRWGRCNIIEGGGRWQSMNKWLVVFVEPATVSINIWVAIDPFIQALYTLFCCYFLFSLNISTVESSADRSVAIGSFILSVKFGCTWEKNALTLGLCCASGKEKKTPFNQQLPINVRNTNNNDKHLPLAQY